MMLEEEEHKKLMAQSGEIPDKIMMGDIPVIPCVHHPDCDTTFKKTIDFQPGFEGFYDRIFD